MKTPEEIKKGLALCSNGNMRECMQCPYPIGFECFEQPMKDALAYIEELESRLAQVERERNAAVADLEKYKGCGTCKFQDVQFECDDYQSCAECDNDDCPCFGISVDNCWQWRGVCAENTEEG